MKMRFSRRFLLTALAVSGLMIADALRRYKSQRFVIVHAQAGVFMYSQSAERLVN